MNRLYEAARGILNDIITRGEHRPDNNSEEYSDYPHDSNGNPWYPEVWELKEAVEEHERSKVASGDGVNDERLLGHHEDYWDATFCDAGLTTEEADRIKACLKFCQAISTEELSRFNSGESKPEICPEGNPALAWAVGLMSEAWRNSGCTILDAVGQNMKWLACRVREWGGQSEPPEN